MSARSRSRGYTVVELMMALAVFSAGVTGIITMQRTAVNANRTAKNVELAASIAQAWEAQLAADASMWRQTFDANTPFLRTINSGMDGAWQLPAYNAGRQFGSQFDSFGRATTDATQAYFCVHVRLTWLYWNTADVAGTLGTAGNGTIRTDVRVFWPREGAERLENDCSDGTPGKVDAVADAVDKYYFVLQTGAVRQP